MAYSSNIHSEKENEGSILKNLVTYADYDKHAIMSFEEFKEGFHLKNTVLYNMTKENNLKRFIDAQEADYQIALSEIKNGRKQSHWMWYIFPQIQGLGFSETSKFYAIKDLMEAEEFLKHSVLGSRLIHICQELLGLKYNDANKIFGSPDDLKLKSSMTLFSALPNPNPIFQLVLEKFFNGTKDNKTLLRIDQQQ